MKSQRKKSRLQQGILLSKRRSRSHWMQKETVSRPMSKKCAPIGKKRDWKINLKIAPRAKRFGMKLFGPQVHRARYCLRGTFPPCFARAALLFSDIRFEDRARWRQCFELWLPNGLLVRWNRKFYRDQTPRFMRAQNFTWLHWKP